MTNERVYSQIGIQLEIQSSFSIIYVVCVYSVVVGVMPKFVVASTPNVESKMLILPHLAVHNVHVPLEFVNFSLICAMPWLHCFRILRVLMGYDSTLTQVTLDLKGRIFIIYIAHEQELTVIIISL